MGRFKKDVVGSVVADLEVDLLLARVGDEVQVLVEHAIAEAIRSRLVVVGAVGGGDLLDVQEAAHQLVAGVDLQHAVGAGPVLDAPRQLVLRLLRAGGKEEDGDEQGIAHEALRGGGDAILNPARRGNWLKSRQSPGPRIPNRPGSIISGGVMSQALDNKMPPGIPYIVWNEFAERFCYYGINAILAVYMTQHLHFGQARSEEHTSE